MDFIKDWKPIKFLPYKGKELLTLADVIPFIFSKEIKNARGCNMDGDNIMILYDLSLEFHEHICNEIGIIYGIKEDDMVTISIIVNKNNTYLNYIKIIKPVTTFLDLNSDILSLINDYLNFADQLKLRITCKAIKKTMIYKHYENSKCLSKLGKLIKNCSSIVIDINNEWGKIDLICNFHDNKDECIYDCRYLSIAYNLYSTNGIYSDLKVREISSKSEFHYTFTSYTNFKILNIDYDFRELLDNIEIIKSLELLIKLLDFDNRLRRLSKSFSQKDKTLMNQHKLSRHFYKTNDCYFKFNKDLKKFFDNTEWFNKVKNIICGKIKLEYSYNYLKSNINEILDFGEKVNDNYEEIKGDLSQCKRKYHDKRRHPYKYWNKSSSDSSSDY